MNRLPVEGETFGRYRLVRQLGEGGMGVVYVAEDATLERKVALKLVLPRHAADPEFRSRFAREAATQARLESPRVVRVYDYGEQDGVLFLCTQYVEGGDLASRVGSSGALAPALAVEVASQVLEGLDEAHQAGVIHRDVKPANVLLRPRGDSVQAYLCDFGIATMAGQGLTRTGQVIGSLPWMAPERHYGVEPGAVGDVYSAGCVLWYALTGQAPYVGSDGEVMMGHIEGPVPQLPGRSPFVKRTNAVLAKALAKDPGHRYPTAGAMAADLDGLAAIAPGEVRMADATVVRPAITKPTTGPRGGAAPAPTTRPRWRVPLAAATAVVAVAAGAFAIGSRTDDDASLADGSIRAGGGEVAPLATRPTLSPLSRHRTTKDAPPAVVSDPGSSLVVPDGVAGGGTTITGGGSTVTGPRSSGGQVQSTVTSAPSPRYRCWNGPTVVDLSSCSWPEEVDGARWMVDNISGCYRATLNDSRVTRDRFGCKVPGATETVYVERATSVASARGFLMSRMPDPDVVWEWSQGWQMRQHATGHWEFGRYWTGPDEAAWFVYIDAPTEAERNAAVDAFKNHCRAISEIRGVPL